MPQNPSGWWGSASRGGQVLCGTPFHPVRKRVGIGLPDKALAKTDLDPFLKSIPVFMEHPPRTKGFEGAQYPRLTESNVASSNFLSSWRKQSKPSAATRLRPGSLVSTCRRCPELRTLRPKHTEGVLCLLTSTSGTFQLGFSLPKGAKVRDLCVCASVGGRGNGTYPLQFRKEATDGGGKFDSPLASSEALSQSLALQGFKGRLCCAS